MRRGFLNGKKAKDDNGTPTAKLAMVAPPKQLGKGSTASLQTKLSKPITSSTHSHPVEPYTIVRVPFLKSAESKDPSSICILRESTYATVINTPGFHTALPPLNPTNVVFTKNTPNTGVGLFAKCNIKVHQVAFSERPLLLLPKAFLFDPQGSKEKEEAINKYELMFEGQLQQALSLMNQEDANAYTSLFNCLPNRPWLYGIAMTNAFNVSIKEENLEENYGYGAVGRLASRINHCCAPNLEVDFDVPSFSIRAIALRDIKAGEQFFCCYCQLDLSFKERRKKLATYGFVCQCQACVNATPESDKLRAEKEKLLGKFIDEKEEMFANPRFNVRSLDPLLKLEKDIVKEGLDFGQNFVDLLFIILQAYYKLNNIAKGMEYFNKVNKYRGQTME